MSKLKEPRIHALALILAIFLGLLIGIAFPVVNLHLVAPVITDYLLPLFFIAVGIELRNEFQHGQFKDRRNIVAPSVGALFGVIAPAIIFFFVTQQTNGSWAIPTATDITLGIAALGMVALRVANPLRARFLALATIDDVIGLVILLVVFSAKLDFVRIAIVLIAVALFALSQRFTAGIALIGAVFALVAVVAGVGSGIQTSLIGFGLGFLVSKHQHFRWLAQTNGLLVLPLFGFSVSAVAGNEALGGLSAIVLFALVLRPLGKFAGIALGGYFGARLAGAKDSFNDWMIIGVLGGLGLTVSLLIAEIAYKTDAPARASAVIGTLVASAISFVAFIVIAKIKDRRAHLVEK